LEACLFGDGVLLGCGGPFPFYIKGEQAVGEWGELVGAWSSLEIRAKLLMAQLKAASQQLFQSKCPPTKTQQQCRFFAKL